MWKLVGIIWLAIGANASAQLIHPRFSPDGEHVVFYNRTGDTASIERIRADGREHEVLLADQGYYGNPGYLGDGPDLVIAGSLEGMRGGWDVFRLIPSGELVPLTQTADREMHASASPSGLAIVFVRFEGDEANLIELDLDSGMERVLTANSGRHFHPKYTADGHSVVFDRTIDGQTGIYRMDLLTGQVEALFVPENEGEYAVAPAMSPDGNFIAFNTRETGANYLVVMDLATGEIERPVSTQQGIGGAHWSPDGTQIVFHQETPDGYEIRLLNIASGEVQTLVTEAD